MSTQKILHEVTPPVLHPPQLRSRQVFCAAKEWENTQHPWETPRTLGLLLTLAVLLQVPHPFRKAKGWASGHPRRRCRPARHEWNLPNGCVLAARYRSR